MYHHYFYWQFVVAPLWLMRLFGNLERALIRFFSVPVMLRYLFAPWHKDTISYRQGSISGILEAFGLNMVSRGVGAVIRSFVLVAFFVSQLALLVFAFITFTSFLLLPFLAVFLVISGLLLLRNTLA